jgi:hypothetical protein
MKVPRNEYHEAREEAELREKILRGKRAFEGTLVESSSSALHQILLCIFQFVPVQHEDEKSKGEDSKNKTRCTTTYYFIYHVPEFNC